MAGDVERVKQLLEQVYDVDNNRHIRHIHHQHSRGLSALHEAVSRGHPEVVAVFMGAGADPDDPTSRGKTPLHLAADIGSVEICNILLAAGADAALVDPEGVTALGVAVREGHGEVVKVLVDRDPDIFSDRGSGALFHDAAFHGHREILAFLIAAATEGRSFGGHYGFSIDRGNPLHAAAANGHTEIARLLLQAGASLTSENSQGQTPLDLARDQGHDDLAQILKQSIQLFDAVENGDGEQARQLLARGAAYVDARRDFVETPLHLAVLANHVDMAQLLIEAGANVNAIYLNLYRTPLMLATIEGHTDMMKLLIEAGADLDARDEGVRTALLFAIAGLEYRPSLEPARLLLQAGADPNIGSRYGTPLSQAIDHGAMEIVHLLIQAGVDVNAVVDQFDTTPLHKAAGRGDDETAVRIAEALIQAGANVNAPPNIPPTFVTGGTPLGLAAGRTNVAMVRLLIAHGADVHARGRFDAPLHFAARSGNLEIAQALMEAGADLQAGNVNHEGDADNSPLHLAIYHGHGDLARLFIEAGADVQARNHAGNPPVQVAAFAGLPEVIKLLVEAGSPVNLQDQAGDTPLHDAAAQGQGEVVYFPLCFPLVFPQFVNPLVQPGLTGLDLCPDCPQISKKECQATCKQ